MSDQQVLVRRKLRVNGVVQGVGFRPFIYRLAKQHNLAGWVRNTSNDVQIEVEGSPDSLDEFVRRIHTDAPALARVDSVSAVEAEPDGGQGFSILESRHTLSTEALIPADVSTCSECFQEIADPNARRRRYPFTNCTNCGPRFTIIQGVPYGRVNTTMSAFQMCRACAAEYRNPEDRRFHAEPIACPACGPKVWLEESDVSGLKSRNTGDCASALARAGRLLHEGKIVAVKGLGGFHLACDARNDAAVGTLRARKGRVGKPFAIMVRDMEEAERLCELGKEHRSALLSYERPIVLAKRRGNGEVSESAAPGNRFLGIMLPYTPLHALLFEHSPPTLVMTSGNLREEPLAYTNESALSKLAGLADAFLLHDRDIQVPCDDSVIRPVARDIAIPIRRARGFVPNTIKMPVECEGILGCGAEQKNTFCIAWDRTAVLSQHIGDLDTVETFDYYQYAIAHFKALCQRNPKVIAHDLHPSYLSTRYAAEQSGAELIGVQHHHAHVASCLAENGRAEKCIGVALDGTGYGTDGTIWGGEILAADLAEFSRVGHLASVRLPGGEAAVRDPRRMAAAYLHAVYREDFENQARRLGLELSALESSVLRRQLESGLNSPMTSSAGRLFDAVSAAVGVCRERTYEGQPAVELEMIADEHEDGYYPACVTPNREALVLDTLPIFRASVEEYLSGTHLSVVSARFHNSVVGLLSAACEIVRERTGLELVALSGGVFQNALILARLRKRLEQAGFEVLIHSLVPPNDGGVSLGQAAVAAARLLRE